MTEEAERYWREFEASTGERVETRALGQWFESPERVDGFWGILVLTDRSFRFIGQESDNWLAGVLGGFGRKKAEPKSVEVVVSRDCLLALKEPPRTRFSRFFGPTFPKFELSWMNAGEEAVSAASFTLDSKSEFLGALRAAMPVAGSTDPGAGAAKL